MKKLIFLIFVLILLTNCNTVTPPKESLLFSDTLYFQRLDTSLTNATLIPKFHTIINSEGIKMQKIVIDTIVPAKNKNGKITGKSKLKISSNEDGNLEFEGETENLIDSIPQINKVVKVEVPAEKEKSFWEKLGDNFLSFLNIIFLILGAGAAYLLLALRKHFSNNNKNFD